jgi:hypothetical protein
LLIAELWCRNTFNPNETIDSKVMTTTVLARCTFGQKHNIPQYITYFSKEYITKQLLLLSTCVQEIQNFHADFTNDTLAFF